jgi:heme oxygenase
VRYLGDLSGGQYIRRRIAKVYGLADAQDASKGDGVQFYIFKNSDGGEAGKADMQRLKDWYRTGMDAGVGDDPILKGKVHVMTASVSFVSSSLSSLCFPVLTL